MFTTKYRLSEHDYLEFNRYAIRRYWKKVALQILSPGVTVGLLCYLLLNRDTHNPFASALAALGVALLLSLLYGFHYRSHIKATVAKQIAADPSTLEEREIFLTAEGFRERTAINDSFHAWRGLESVGITTTYVFLHLNAFTAYIIPRSTLPVDAVALVASSVLNTKLWRHNRA
jgi:hypothetical protein